MDGIIQLREKERHDLAVKIDTWTPQSGLLNLIGRERRMIVDALRATPAQPAGMREALEFYADPETYHAIAFLGDAPCGEFVEDFGEDDWTTQCGYGRPMPGKRARAILALPAERPAVAHLDARKSASLDIATEIGALLDEYISIPSAEAVRRDIAQGKLRDALWDNKAGIISLLAAFARGPGAPAQSAPVLDQAWRDSTWLGLSASEKACYYWPEDTDLHSQCRAAYIAGATHYALPSPVREAPYG